MEKTCPSSDILSRFAAATLSDDEVDAVVAHLADCEACARTVDEMELKPDPAMLVTYRGLKDNPVETGEVDMPLHKKIGQYEILQQIGHGGMGVVYRAVHPHLKREVALKVIRDSRLGDPAARERFVQEMQSLGKLTHPNIVHANDAGIDGDTPFIVTELLDGRDLGSYIEEHGKMPVKQAADCIRQAATGLAYAHKAGYVHRDIKPSNLFLTRDGVVKILDLGIARQADSNIVTGQTMTGHVVGSPDFMAPEQFRGGTVDARSDIYSLGQTFLYILTGNAHSGNVGGVPVSSRKILARMTAGVPSQRFQTAEELIRALTAASKQSRLAFRVMAVAALILAAACFIRLSALSDPVADRYSISPVSSEQQNETIKEETRKEDEEKSADIRGFDITSPVGWDGFFDDITKYYMKFRIGSWTDHDFTVFRFLHQLGRHEEAERIISAILTRPVSVGDLTQSRDRLRELNMIAHWMSFVGEQEKSDEYHIRIEKMIDDEPSELKRESLRNTYNEQNKNYENRKKRNWPFVDENYLMPVVLKELVLKGKPSVKTLCDEGEYREAMSRYSALRRELGLSINHVEANTYSGYGTSYIVSRMIEKGDLESAAKFWQEAPCSNLIYFRMGCLLTLGYLKADRKNEAQIAWNHTTDKVSVLTKIVSYASETEVVCCLLESIVETDLYEYVRSQTGE